jgi:glycosyltransferase involved in cell wall biosynthesis
LINAAFLTSESLGGSWTYASNLISSITRLPSPHEFIIVANRRFADRLSGDTSRSSNVLVDFDARAKLHRVAWEQWSLPRIVRQLGIDIVHSTGNVLPLLPCVPSIVTLHDLQYLEYPEYFSPTRRIYLRFVVPRSMCRASMIIAISEFTRESLHRMLNISTEKIRVVYEGGVSLKDRSLQCDEQKVAQKFKLTRPFYLSVGSSLPHKNLPRLIRAFASVVTDIPYDLVIVGEHSPHEHILQQTINAVGVANVGRVRLLGFISRQDLMCLYHRAEAFVFPSLYEGFGIPVLEAMDCGCPVLASNRTALPEIIGDAGILFDPTNVDDIARSLREIYRDPTVRSSLKEKGLKRAQEFSWQRMAEQTLQLYEELGHRQEISHDLRIASVI